MKCYSCGAEIGLTTGKCPYCGRKIKENASHRRDLAKYKKRSKEVKTEAGNIVSNNIPMVISAIVMFLLLIGIGFAAYLDSNAYTIRTDMQHKDSVKKYDQYINKIQDYLDAGDYTGFHEFAEYHKIYAHMDPYSDLEVIDLLAGDYVRMVNSIEQVIMIGPEPDWYDPEYDIRDCASEISLFYSSYNASHYDIEDDPYKDYIVDMKEQADTMLEVYLGLDEEARNDFLDCSDSAKAAYIEEVVLGE